MKTTSRLATSFVLAGVAVLGACRSKDNTGKAASGDSAAVANSPAGSLEGPTRADSARTASGMQGMNGMQGMKGGQMAGTMGAGMMDSMQTHLRMMEGTSAGQMKAMLPAHRQMVANMLSRMNGDMRKMNMKPDAKWTALMDSVRQDLVRMPEMSAAEMRTSMPAHSARMMRLMQMHRSMMGGMTM